MTLLKKEMLKKKEEVIENRELDEYRELLTLLEKIDDKKIKIHFLTVKDMMEATGFSKNKVLELFNDPEFPSCNYGKAQIAEINAVIDYFSKPRKKEDSSYWRNLSA